MQKSIILYGYNFNAECFCYRYARKERIIGIVSDLEEIDEFFGGARRIEEADFYNRVIQFDKIFVYIMYEFETPEYTQIKEKLEQYGKKECQDFTSYIAYGKKMAIINANCHVDPYKKYLSLSKEFCNIYYIYPLGPIQRRFNVIIPENVLAECDLYIHQVIHPTNQFEYEISDEFVFKKLKNSCIRIAVPNLVLLGECFFPQLTGMNTNHPKEGYNFGLFPLIDIIIEKGIKDGMTVEEIEQCYTYEDVFDHEKIEREFREFWNRLEKRETEWDIKISDYIKRIYRNHRLFLSPSHPTQIVFNEIGTRILKYLDISEDINYQYELPDGYPITGCVKKVLNLDINDKVFRAGEEKDTLTDTAFSLKEYIKEYVYWVFECPFRVKLKTKLDMNKRTIFYKFGNFLFGEWVNTRIDIIITSDLFHIDFAIQENELEKYSECQVVIGPYADNRKIADKLVKLGYSKEALFLLQSEDKRVEYFKSISYEELVIYGNGYDATEIIDLFADKSCIYICDRRIRESYSERGINYITCEKLYTEHLDATVFVTSTKYGQEILSDLIGLGFMKEKIILNNVPYKRTVYRNDKIYKLGDITEI